MSLAPAMSAARPPIPHYLYFCVRQALFRPADPVPTRLSYLVLCAGGDRINGAALHGESP